MALLRREALESGVVSEAPEAPPPITPFGRPRKLVPIITAIVLVAIVVSYAIAGYLFASSRIHSAKTTFYAVVSHQNAITDELNSLNSKVVAVTLTSASSTDQEQLRAAYVQMVNQARAAQPTIAADDASLATAQSQLKDNSWLTVFSRYSLDTASAKMGHERKALATAKTITADLILLATFYQSFYDSFIDLDILNTKAQATDLTGAGVAITTLTADVAKAIQLSSAPGLPPEMKLYLTDFQTLAVDFGQLLNAAVAGDTSGAQAGVKAVEADKVKLDSHDMDKINAAIRAFYKPLTDAYNSEIAKANGM